MSDAAALRLLASEHNIEFVDLDRYKVDPSAASVLPVELARRHRAVPIGRKFGAPVVAIADPDDLAAMDVLKATIGRDFISVLAAVEQIDACVDRVYSPRGSADPDHAAGGDDDVLKPVNGGSAAARRVNGHSANGHAAGGAAGVLDGTDLGVDGLGTADGLGISIYGMAFAPTQTPLEAPEHASRPAPASRPGTSDPSTPVVDRGPVAAEPATAEPVVAEPVVAEPVVAEPVVAEPVVAEPVVAEPVVEEPVVEEPVVEEPVVAEPAVEVSLEETVSVGPVTDASAPAESVALVAPDEPSENPTSVQETLDDQHGLGTTAAPERTAAAAPPEAPGTRVVPEIAGVQEVQEVLETEGSIGSDATVASGEHESTLGLSPPPPPPPPVSGAYPVASEEVDSSGAEPALDLSSFGGLPSIDDLSSEIAAIAGDVETAADLVDVAVAEFEQGGGGSFTPLALSGAPPISGAMPGGASTNLLPPDLAARFPPLARALVEGGRVSLEDMEAVIDEHYATGQTVARILTARGLVTEADLMWGMAHEMGLEFVDLDLRPIDYSAAYMLPENTARHHSVIVISNENGTPVVAAANPSDVFAMDDVRTIIGRNFVTVVATRSQILAAIDRAYHGGGDATTEATKAAIELDVTDSKEPELENLQAVVEDAPIVRYVNLLILQALNERASDIHVEPTADKLRIRYRIDGVLHDMSSAPKGIAASVTTRLKVMADMDIAEHRLPQDGRISVNVGPRQIDLRMATLPTTHGEKMVMRVLDKSSVVLSLEDLGFEEDLLRRYREVYSKPYGTILVTGPTGSGKTTTLYATLAALDTPEKNIITVEDPVELQLPGINQVQVNAKVGLTFPTALRSIMRSDPDVVLVGEIRDRETAMISVEAALTGHLVLATLHTNDAASTPMRLVEMGVEPFLVTSAVSGVVAQRLIRRLCTHCKEPFEATEADIAAAGWKPEEVFEVNDKPTLYRATGCPACSNTGYRGRRALVEFLVVTEDIDRLIVEGASVESIHRMAVDQGMVTLRQAGLHKALAGETSLEEVLRVVA
jgi:type IV pilus assembly protein PilB